MKIKIIVTRKGNILGLADVQPDSEGIIRIGRYHWTASEIKSDRIFTLELDDFLPLYSDKETQRFINELNINTKTKR